MYDLDRDGFISKAELIQVMAALQKVTGSLTSPSGKTYASPDQMVRCGAQNPAPNVHV